MATATPPQFITGVPGGLLPPNIAPPIFAKTMERSAVMQLAREVPLSIDVNTAIPVPLSVPTAGWVGEGGVKPLGAGGVGIKTMTAKKVAVLIPVSEEVARTNPAGIYEQLQNDLPTALARAYDYAAIHGKDLKTGGSGPFGDFLAQTSNTQLLGGTTGTTQANGGIYGDLVKGMQQVVNAGWDFGGFVADTRLNPQLLLATTTQGMPILTNPSGTASGTAMGGNLLGYDYATSQGVSGLYRRQNGATDSGIRAIGGDWSQVAYGVGQDITIKVSTEAGYTDEAGVVHSAFQENLVLILAEAYFGFVMGEANAFVAYQNASS